MTVTFLTVLESKRVSAVNEIQYTDTVSIIRHMVLIAVTP